MTSAGLWNHIECLDVVVEVVGKGASGAGEPHVLIALCFAAGLQKLFFLVVVLQKLFVVVVCQHLLAASAQLEGADVVFKAGR